MKIAALRQMAFKRYLCSRALSGVAVQVQTVAVGWLIYETTGDPLDLGFAGLAQFLPYFPTLLVSGLVADKFGRRQIMIVCALVQCLCAVCFAFVYLLDLESVLPLFLILSIFGATRAFVHPAQMSLIFNLVPTVHLGSAIALNSAVGRLAVIVGPVLGGGLYAVSPDLAFSSSSLCFLLAAGAAGLIPRQNDEPKVTFGTSSWSALAAGFPYVWSDRRLLGLLSLDLFAVVLGSVTALLPVFASDLLSVGPFGLGLLHAAPAVGALIVAVLISAYPIRRNAGKTMLVSVAVFGVAVLCFGLSRNMFVSMIALAIAGAADMFSVCIRHTLIQVWTPDHLRGRVTAVNSLFTGASNELGAFRAGLLAGLIGTVPTVVVGGVATVALAGLWVRLFPRLLAVQDLEGRQ